ncbi:hypothetical protein GCM10009755_03250 [Brevibacterium samyangense]|uniref:DUF1707 domain-containing protein n=2 Tax=Brevibacterium samyangense TaxID=366888 RepID=A0ABP5EI78_9MICO
MFMSDSPFTPAPTPDPERGASADDAAAHDPARTLRIGHAERDEVIEILRDAAAEGRIDTEELTERIERTVNAKFYVDLDAVVADLPVPPPSSAVRKQQEFRAVHQAPGASLQPYAAGPLATGDEPGHHPADPLVLRATWENEKRTGRWNPPPFIRLEPVAATAEINFLEVTTPLREIDVEVTSGMGMATIVVPETWGVNIDRLSSSWGTVKSKVSAVPQDGYPLVRVHGSVGMATFTARGAGYFERKRLEKG